MLKKGYTFAYWFRCNFESIYIEHSIVATFSHDFSPCMVSSRTMFLALQICTSDFPIPMWYILHRIRQKSDRMSLLVRCGQIIFDNINVLCLLFLFLVLLTVSVCTLYLSELSCCIHCYITTVINKYTMTCRLIGYQNIYKCTKKTNDEHVAVKVIYIFSVNHQDRPITSGMLWILIYFFVSNFITNKYVK